MMLRFTGRLDALSAGDRQALLNRATGQDPAIRERTRDILADVRTRGDSALRDLARRFDGITLETLEIPRDVCDAALDHTAPALRRAMERAAANIAFVARSQLPAAMECEPEPGLVVGRRPDALRRVGIYAPGGRAAYPSSVLMGAIPARVAGVREVVLCSPPQRDGLPSQPVLAAAALADVDRVFAVGGAGAIGALSYGTETIPRVDRIVGPGNAYVAEAKLQVTNAVAIDAPAGPSEVLIVADDSCNPRRMALEMIAQAEHDPMACAIAVTIGDATACALAAALASLTPTGVAREALEAAGGILVVDTIDAAVDFASDYAPEHLLVATRDCERVNQTVRGAGTVFLGERASVAFGDYMTGANHVLPTGGLARSYSGLSVLDFVRWTTYQRFTNSAARSLATDVATFASAEGLPGHAASANAAGDFA